MILTSTMGPAEAQHVPLLRLDNAEPELVEQILESVSAVAALGAFTMGSELEAFEREYGEWIESPHVVGVSSGTEALVLALKALEIGAGDEVIVPANSFIATAEAVALANATPVLVDCDPDTHLLTAEAVAAAITPRVKAVIPVHLYGATVDMDPIMEVAREAGIAVIEDTAQAHGARYKGTRVGTIGDLGCFSFYPTKNLGGWGDGGAVVSADPELADRVRLLRSHGERPRYHHRMIGTTARLDALQAAVLRVKLHRLEGWNSARRRHAARLRRALEGAHVELPAMPAEGGDHVYHLFIVRTKHREALRAHLSERLIDSAVHYPIAIHRTEAFAYLGLGAGSRPVAERLAEEVVTLPLWPGMTSAQVDAVAHAVRTFVPPSNGRAG
jgi:dTDP-3-amino-3,4,6-trideoxy-alpha-D-glucose transaminase